MSESYGCKGCTCWAEQEVQLHNGHTETRWMPNAGCPHHGMLAGYARARIDTGQYRVVKLDASGIPDDVNDTPEIRARVASLPDAVVPIGYRPQTTTENKEHGVLAAIRRWSRGGHRVFTGWRN